MAPPPKYIITRKLISHFFQNYLPTSPVIISSDATKMFECWEQFGIDSGKCEEFEELFDRAHTKMMNYKERIKSLKLKSLVLSHLKRPVYKSMLKGRFREKIVVEEKDIFNGLY